MRHRRERETPDLECLRHFVPGKRCRHSGTRHGPHRIRSHDSAARARLTGVHVHAWSAVFATSLHGRSRRVKMRRKASEQFHEQPRRRMRPKAQRLERVGYGTPGPSGTNKCSPDCPDVFGNALSPAPSMISRSERAIVIASSKVEASTSRSSVMKSQASSDCTREARI